MGLKSVIWISANGHQIDFLGTNGIRLLETPVGLGMTPWQWEQLPSPEGHGAMFTTAYAGVRTIQMMVLVYGPSFASRMAELTAALNIGLGDGKLQVTRHDGVTRELVCRYESGLEGANMNRMDASGLVVVDGMPQVGRWAVLPLQFRAAEPFWMGEEMEVMLSPIEGEAFFPNLPLSLSPLGVWTSTAINNPGDVIAWPVWTVRGPGEYLRIVNLDTEEAFALDYTLADNEIITIDTRPGRKSVSSNLTGDLWRYVTEWRMWPLGAGTTNIQVRFQNTEESSAIIVRFRPRYVSLES